LLAVLPALLLHTMRTMLKNAECSAAQHEWHMG